MRLFICIVLIERFCTLYCNFWKYIESVVRTVLWVLNYRFMFWFLCIFVGFMNTRLRMQLHYSTYLLFSEIYFKVSFSVYMFVCVLEHGLSLMLMNHIFHFCFFLCINDFHTEWNLITNVRACTHTKKIFDEDFRGGRADWIQCVHACSECWNLDERIGKKKNTAVGCVLSWRKNLSFHLIWLGF